MNFLVSPLQLVVVSKEVTGWFVRLRRFVILVDVMAQQPCTEEDTAFKTATAET